jgi:hypothetical protein
MKEKIQKKKTNFTHRMALQSLIEHHFPKIFTAVLRNFCLLFGIAMILERKDHRKFGRLESTLSNSLDDVLFQT